VGMACQLQFRGLALSLHWEQMGRPVADHGQRPPQWGARVQGALLHAAAIKFGSQPRRQQQQLQQLKLPPLRHSPIKGHAFHEPSCKNDLVRTR
jgi:hypothetical protein